MQRHCTEAIAGLSNRRMARSHILPEHLRPGLTLVFCGTAAGRQSALRQAYYAHPQNKFWRTLQAVGLTPRRFAPEEYPALWELGIGLTDIAKFAYGMDHQLPRHSPGTEGCGGVARPDRQDRAPSPGLHQPHRRAGGDGQNGGRRANR